MDNIIAGKAKHGKLLDYISPEIIIPVTMIYFAIIYSFHFSWYIGGAIMLIMPVIEYTAILINSITKKRKLILPASYIVIAYFAYITIRHVFSLDILTIGVSDAVISAFALTCMQAQEKEDFIRIFYRVCMTFLWISIISGILSLLTLLIPDSIFTNESLPNFIKINLQNKHTYRIDNNLSRLVGIYPHPNTTAHYCVFGLMFGFGTILLRPTKLENYFYTLIDLVTTVIILILTESRASMLSFAIFCLLLMIVYYTFLRKYIVCNTKIIDFILSFIIAVGVLLVLVLIIFEPIRANLYEILRIPYAEGMSFIDSLPFMLDGFISASGREVLREATLEGWKQNALFGTAASKIVSDFLAPIQSTILVNNSSHNSYIQILATTGIIGLCLFLTLQISSIILLIISIMKTHDRDIKIITVFILVLSIVSIIDNQFEVYYYSNVYTAVLVNFYSITLGFQSYKLLKEEQNA